MLDKLFLSRLNSRGKVAYWVGQIIIIAMIALVIFGVLQLDWDDSGGVAFIITGIISILIWGAVCIAVWPKSKPVKKPHDLSNEGDTP